MAVPSSGILKAPSAATAGMPGALRSKALRQRLLVFVGDTQAHCLTLSSPGLSTVPSAEQHAVSCGRCWPCVCQQLLTVLASAESVAEGMQLRYCLCWALRPLCSELGAAAPGVLLPSMRARLFDALSTYGSAGERPVQACVLSSAALHVPCS